MERYLLHCRRPIYTSGVQSIKVAKYQVLSGPHSAVLTFGAQRGRVVVRSAQSPPRTLL